MLAQSNDSISAFVRSACQRTPVFSKRKQGFFGSLSRCLLHLLLFHVQNSVEADAEFLCGKGANPPAIVVIGSQKLFRLGRNRRTSSMLAARRRDQELIAEAALGSANDRPCLGIRHRHRGGGGAQGMQLLHPAQKLRHARPEALILCEDPHGQHRSECSFHGSIIPQTRGFRQAFSSDRSGFAKTRRMSLRRVSSCVIARPRRGRGNLKVEDTASRSEAQEMPCKFLRFCI